MSLKTEHKTIGEVEYTVMELPAMEQMLLALRLGKQLGEPLAKLSTPGNDKNEEAFAATIGSALGSIDPDEVMSLFRQLFKKNVSKDNRKVQLDMDFQGKLQDVFALAIFIIQVNFQDFFSNLGGIIQGLAPQSAVPIETK